MSADGSAVLLASSNKKCSGVQAVIPKKNAAGWNGSSTKVAAQVGRITRHKAHRAAEPIVAGPDIRPKERQGGPAGKRACRRIVGEGVWNFMRSLPS